MTWNDIRAGNPVKDTLAGGGVVVGAFARLGSVEAVEVCAHAGCDFVIVDMEHAPVSWERAAAMSVAIEAAGATPVLRVSTAARDLITRGLDAGAHGIMVPRVDDPATAEAVVAATRYGPGGTRGAAANRRAGYGLRMSYEEYVAAANRTTLLVLQIESVRGVENAAAIAAVPGVDCLFVGLADLSVDMDLPGRWDLPEVVAQATAVLAACRDAGIAFGVPTPDTAMAREYLRRGARFIAGGDVGFLAGAARAFVDEVRSSSG